MRVLVAGRSAKAVATAAGAFAQDLTIESASTKAACIALLDRNKFDLIVACETLGDGSGLEVLSHAAVNTPNTLRIFAARPSTLNLLQGELGLFGLFRTLSYPINFRKLWAAIDLARSCSVENEPLQTQRPANVETNVGRTGAAANNGMAAGGTKATARTGAGASRSLQVQARQIAGTSARPTAQRATGATVAAARTTASAASNGRGASAGNSTVARTSAAANNRMAASGSGATARNGAVVNNGGAARAASPPRQAPPRQAAQVDATQRAQRSAHAAAVQTMRTSAGVNVGTPAQAATASRQAHFPQGSQARATPTTQRSAQPAPSRTGAVANNGRAAPAAGISLQAQARQVAASPTTSAQRRATAASRRNARIPETEAFRRALAKRNASKLDANSDISAVDILGAVQQSRDAGDRGERRREPAMSNDSLAQLARMATTHRPTNLRGVPGGKKRAAIFVGSGVFAAATAAVLTFFMLNANNSIGRTSLPLVASIARPVPKKVFPWQSWQSAPEQPASTAPIRSEVTAPAAADLDAQAEAESDASAVEPGHPGPPPPNPPPGPSEPPSADSPDLADE